MTKKDAITTVDREVPDIIEDLAAPGPWPMAKIDPVAELKAFEAAVDLQNKLLPASIKATKPQDWVAHGEGVYLQGTGAERISPLWGILYGKYTVQRDDHPDGEFTYVVNGPAGSRRTGVAYANIIGGRSSADPFFDEFDETKPADWRAMSPEQRKRWRKTHRIPPDALEVQKAAVTNWQTRAASMLSGMRGLTVRDLEAAGIDTSQVRKVEYETGKKGGETAPAELKAERVKFGNEVLAAVGGDKEAAKKLFKEVTAGKDFAGFDSIEGIKHQWQIDQGRKKLEAHPVFGKKEAAHA